MPLSNCHSDTLKNSWFVSEIAAIKTWLNNIIDELYMHHHT